MRIWSPEGNEPGSGAERLLESKCNSVSDDSDEMVPVIVPEIDVEDKSLRNMILVSYMHAL